MPMSVPLNQISGIVVPHHDLVKNRRAALFARINEEMAGASAPDTIILVSPNHFNMGKSNVQISMASWQTADGEIAPNTDALSALVDARVATEEPASFLKEHGIRLILGDIKKTFPKANIIPIILKTNTTDEEIASLHDVLKHACEHCVVVASVDFSHYQPAMLARLHDDTSIRALENLDTKAVMSTAEVDSPAALNLLVRWAQSHATEHFSLFDHTNSGVLAKNTDMETTTHVFGWYERGPRAVPEKSVSFFFGGDMMYGRSVAHAFEEKGFEKIFDHLGSRVFWGVDAAVANLEGPISAVPVSDNYKAYSMVFNFSPSVVRALTFLHLTAVSLANNHTLNHGTRGLQTTRDILKKKHIRWIGDPDDASEATIAHIQGEGMTLDVIGVHALNAKVPDIQKSIRTLKKDLTHRVIVFPHWGIEYASRHSEFQEKLAHVWIDAGADMVIGAHPHVIQDIGEYKGRPIVYSMGNFVFDQIFSRQTQEGIFIGGQFREKELEFFALPYRSVGMQPELMRGKEKIQTLDRLYRDVAPRIHQTEYGRSLLFPLQ